MISCWPTVVEAKVSPPKGETKKQTWLNGPHLSFETKPAYVPGHRGPPPRNAWLKMADKTPLPFFLWMLHVWLSEEKTRKLPSKHNWDYSLGLWDSQSLCSINQKQLESASSFRKTNEKGNLVLVVALYSWTLLLLSQLQVALINRAWLAFKQLHGTIKYCGN